MIVSVLYITSPRLIYFIIGSVYLLTPFTHFTHSSPHPPQATTNLLYKGCFWHFKGVCLTPHKYSTARSYFYFC